MGARCDSVLMTESDLTPDKQGRRAMRYSSRSAADAVAWQREVRGRLAQLLSVTDLLAAENRAPLAPAVVASGRNDLYCSQEIKFSSTRGRRTKAIVTIPREGSGRYPAVVCIHGHDGHRGIVYDHTSIYRGFGNSLARRGYVTIATDVGQHEVYEQGRTLMGERLWDLVRCVDYLESLPDVDVSRIACAGLSLGGEMAMWLGAMDERITATVSSGFLTTMDQLEENHCKCWKFPGLRELVDFADIYALTAPRALHCQNGLQEEPIHFDVSVAKAALEDIKVIYEDFGHPENLEFIAHDGGHDVDLSSLHAFFERHLGSQGAGS